MNIAVQESENNPSREKPERLKAVFFEAETFEDERFLAYVCRAIEAGGKIFVKETPESKDVFEFKPKEDFSL